MSLCNEEPSITGVGACSQAQWFMNLGDEFLPCNQLNAAYQTTNIDYMMRLNVESESKPWRLTKIIVTLGEKNSSSEDVKKIMQAGTNILRLNMSHGDQNWHIDTIGEIRNVQVSLTKDKRIPEDSNLPTGIAIDLRGPEIRTGLFNVSSEIPNRAEFNEGECVTLLTDERSKRGGNSDAFWISYPQLPLISKKGDRIMVDKGTVGLLVCRSDNHTIECMVQKSGILRNEASVQPIDTVIDLPHISEQDERDIDFGMDLDCDFIIASHIRCGETILKIKDRIKAGSRPICVLGKICSKQAIDSIDDILKEADGIIIDRRSMELAVGEEKLFIAEKSIVAKCNRIGKPAMVAYDIAHDTKLDLSLLANAVIEGVDGILLSTGDLNVDETVNLIRSVNLVCREAENARWQKQIFQELSEKAPIPVEPTHSIAISAIQLSLKCNASGIIVTTATGRTAMMLSIYRPRCPIVAITRHGLVARWLQLYFAVHPLEYIGCPNRDWQRDMNERIETGMKYLRVNNFVDAGEPVVIVSAWRSGTGFTNSIRVVYASPRLVPNNGRDFEEIW